MLSSGFDSRNFTDQFTCFTPLNLNASFVPFSNQLIRQVHIPIDYATYSHLEEEGQEKPVPLVGRWRSEGKLDSTGKAELETRVRASRIFEVVPEPDTRPLLLTAAEQYFAHIWRQKTRNLPQRGFYWPWRMLS